MKINRCQFRVVSNSLFYWRVCSCFLYFNSDFFLIFPGAQMPRKCLWLADKSRSTAGNSLSALSSHSLAPRALAFILLLTYFSLAHSPFSILLSPISNTHPFLIVWLALLSSSPFLVFWALLISVPLPAVCLSVCWLALCLQLN